MSTKPFATLPSHVRVIFIDTISGLSSALDEVYSTLAYGHQLWVAIDLEWAPFAPDRLEIMQIAMASTRRETVLLIDLARLRYAHDLDYMLNNLFARSSRCLVFDASDVSKLRRDFPSFSAWYTLYSKLDDLRVNESMSLNKLTLLWLGLQMDKTMTMSDWSMRPLTRRMRRYAALDAWILISVYDVQCEGSEPPYPPELSIDEFMQWESSYDKTPVALLFEFAAARGDPAPEFDGPDSYGPPHSCTLHFNGLVADGYGSRKQDARHDAAREMMNLLRDLDE